MPPSSGKDLTKMDINSLMSPPDQVLDSFNTHGYRKASVPSGASHGDFQSLNDQRKHPLPMSPPVSPYSKAISHTHRTPSTPPAQTVSDPVLFADDGATPSPPHAPLFAPNEEMQQNQRIIDSHRARSVSRSHSLTRPSLPSDSEYHLILSFRSQVMTHFNANPKGWLRKERALLEADRRATAHRYHAIMPAKPKHAIAAKPPRIARNDRVTKPAATTSNPNAAPRTVRTGPVHGPGHSPGKRSTSRASPTPEPSRRAVAPNREDKDFNSIPDYCPPSSSLPSRPNSLKIEWKGQPIDLSTDPHAHLLHADEVSLAGNLRLDCATYLTSKRRIFERRLQCLRTGKEFRKTDAQQACKIDVNKASKLWTAFDKVGWLDAKWVRPYA